MTIKRLIGSDPNQVSRNRDLGSMAFQDAKSITVGTATVGPTSSANFTRFSNTQFVVSNTAVLVQQNENVHNIGIVGEGVASTPDSTIWGIGVYGVGYTSANTRCSGVVGEGHVQNTADVGSAIGVRGYSNDTHAGGLNVGLYGDAAGGSANYALYLSRGNIFGNTAVSCVLSGGHFTFTSPANTYTLQLVNVTTTQKNSITPAAGLIIFDSTLGKMCVANGSAWQTVTST